MQVAVMFCAALELVPRKGAVIAATPGCHRQHHQMAKAMMYSRNNACVLLADENYMTVFVRAAPRGIKRRAPGGISGYRDAVLARREIVQHRRLLKTWFRCH